MSQTIDSKVVEMQFDNRQFEQNVSTTLLTLSNLKSALQLDKAADGFANITKAAKNMSLGGLSAAVTTVTSSFSALEVAGVTAMVRITNAVINLGKRIVNDLAIAPVMQGFNEYELKMGSVQTIMASTGESIKTVSAYLEELNKYADRTIYSFSDMTNSIGKFTNAGVSLESAVAAIKGVSNEAAVSGANAAEASRAMYNFAQALSAGYVKLIDWKSIENANMATKDFKQQLIETAVAMGTVVKAGNDYNTVTTNNNGKIMEGFNATKNFNDSLSAQWMTTEVLVQTLNNYATDVRDMTDSEVKAYEQKLKAVGYTEKQIAAIEELGKKAFDAAQDIKTFTQLMDTLKEAAGSGWAQTFELIFGDLEEAKKLWTGVSQAVGGFIDKTSEARNNLLRGALRDIVDPKKLTDIGPDKLGIGEKEWLALKKVIKDTAKEQGIAIDKMIDANGGFENSLKQGWLTSDLLAKSLDKVNKLTTKKTVEQITSVRDAALKVINGDYGTGIERVNKLTAEGLDAKKVQKYVNLIYELSGGTWNYSKSVLDAVDKQMDLKATIDDVSDAELKNLGYTDEEIKALRKLAKSAKEAGTPLNELINIKESGSGRDLLIESFANLYKIFAEIAGVVSRSWTDIFSPVNARQLYEYIKRFNDLTKQLKPNIKSLTRIRILSKGIFSALNVGKKVLVTIGSTLLPVFNDALQRLGGILIDNALKVADYFIALNRTIDSSESLRKVSEHLRDILSSVFKIGLGIIERLFPVVFAVADVIGNSVIAPAWSAFEKILGKIRDRLVAITESTSPLWSTLDKVFKRITSFIQSAKVEQFLTSIWSLVERVGSAIITMVSTIFSNVNMGDVMSSLMDFGTFVGTNIVEAFEKASGSISDFIEKIKNMSFADITLNVKSIFTSAIEYITSGQMVKDLLGAFPSLETVINNFLQKIADIANGLGAGLDVAAVNVTTFGTAVSDLLGKIQWDSVLALVSSVLGIFGLRSLYKVIYSMQMFAAGFKDFGELLSTTVKKINGVFTSIKKFFDAARWSLLGAVFIEFAIGVGILALSLIELGKLPRDQYQQGLEAITLISMGLVGVFGVVKSLSFAPGDISGVGFMMIAMAGAIYILSKTLAEIAQINFGEHALSTFVALGLLVVAMAGVYKVISSSKVQKASDLKTALINAASILLLALALKLVVWSLNDIAKMDLDHPLEALFTLLAIMGVLALVGKAMEKFSLKTGFGVLGLAIGIKIFIGIIRDIANDRTLLRDTVKAMPTLILIAGLMGVLMLATRAAGEHALKAGGAIVLIGIALNLMLLAIGGLTMLAALRPRALETAIKALVRVMGGVAALIVASGWAGEHALKAGVMMIAIAGALTLIAIAMGIMSTIPTVKMVIVTSIISVFIILFGGLMYVSKFVGSSMGTVIAIASVIALLALCMIALYNISDTDKLLKVSLSLVLVLAALAIVFDTAASLQKLTPKSVLALAGMVIAIGLIAAIVVLMANNITDADAALKSAGAIAILLVSVGAILGILGALNIGPRTAFLAGAAFDVFVLMIGGIAAVIHAITDILGFDLKGWIDEAIPVVEGLGQLFGAFGKGFLEIYTSMQTAKTEDPTSFIDKFIGIAEKLSGITEDAVKGAKNLADMAGALAMVNFTSALGGFFSFGADVAVLAFEEIMPRLATAVGTYAQGLKDAGVDDTLIKNSTAAMGLLQDLANVDLGRSSGVFAAFTGSTAKDIESFGEKLPMLGTALGEFGYKLKYYKSIGVDMSDGAIEEASGLLSMLGKMASSDIGNSSGLISKIAGFNGTDISEFASNLPRLASALGYYCMRLNAFPVLKDNSVIKMAKDSIKLLGDLGKISQGLGHSSESLIMAFAGATSDDMKLFSENLPLLATALGGYVNGLSGINFEDSSIDESITALEKLGVLATTGIGSSAGLIDFFGGKTSDDMQRFAENLPKLAKGLVDYQTNLADFSPSGVGISIHYLGRFGEILATLKTSGVLENSTDTISTFGLNLDALGSHVSSFSYKVQDVDLSVIDSIKEFIEQVRLILVTANHTDPSAVDKVQETLDRLANLSVDGLVARLSTGKNEVEAAALDLITTLSNAFSKAPDLTTSIDSFIAGIKRQFENRSETFNGIGKSLAKNIGSGLSSGLSGAASMSNAGEAASKAFAAVSDTVGDYGDAGTQAMSNFASGIAAGSSGVKTAVSKVALEAVSTVRANSVVGFTGAGRFAVLGFANGITSNTYIATAKAKAMAEKAKEAAKRALDERSPSKEFYKIGDYAVQGFANAFSDGNDLSYDSGFELANRARVGLGSALTKISSLIENGIDTQPTIRPVLDLSDVENGASTLGGMLNLNPSVGVSNNLGAIGNYMMFRNQNATNDDVVAAIKQLQKNLGPMGDNITINGVTYDDGSNINDAVRSIIRAARVERRA